MKDLRGIVTKIVIVSFSAAALLGILALLGGSFGETQGRVLLTTVVVGVESVAALCYLAVAGRSTAVVGLVGGLVSLVPFGLALWLTWANEIPSNDAVWKTFGVSLTIAVSIAQVCLLLAVAGRRRVGSGLTATLVAIAVVAVMIVLPIIDGSDLNDTYWRVFGVVAILDVLGTVILAALGAFGKDPQTPASEPTGLTTEQQSRVLDAAKQRGTSPQRVISDALDSLLD